MKVQTDSSEVLPPMPIVALFSGLLGHGGVQEAGRHTAAALDLIARQSKRSTRFLSLNDSRGAHSIVAAGCEITFNGFARDKILFAAAAIRAAHDASRESASFRPVLLAAHPNLALPAALARFFSPRCRLVVQSHGVEVWHPLPFLRRFALMSASLVLAPSHHTAQQLASEQRIIENRIVRLPW